MTSEKNEYVGLHCFYCGTETGNTDECVPCGIKRLQREQQEENARIRAEEHDRWESSAWDDEVAQ